MASIRKGEHKLEVIKHPQPFGQHLYEVLAPDGYSWGGDTWSIHGASLADLKTRVSYTELETADSDCLD